MTDPTDDTPDLARAVEAWIRHGEAVPAHITTYDRAIVNQELRDLLARHHQPDRATQPTEAAERLRDLTRRLGFGDNITEPQADNDTIVAWWAERMAEADEWREHERFRDECALGGHLQDEDCQEHVPTCCNAQHPARTQPTAETRTVETDEREALARAWDEGARVGAEWDSRCKSEDPDDWPGADEKPPTNPYRAPARADDPTGSA